MGVVPFTMALNWVCCRPLLPTVALLALPEPRGSHLKLLKNRFCSKTVLQSERVENDEVGW